MVILRNGVNTEQHALDYEVKCIAHIIAIYKLQVSKFTAKAKRAVLEDEQQLWSEYAKRSAQHAKALSKELERATLVAEAARRDTLSVQRAARRATLSVKRAQVFRESLKQ